MYSEYTPVIDAIKYQLKDAEIECFREPNELTDNFDLVILVNYSGKCELSALSCRHSLLPAFDCEEPVKEALLAGVKVTGITIYKTDTKKIIAQYPVLISENMHYDELEQELNYLEQTIYPLVAEKVLMNEQFEIKSLLGAGCTGSCGGCSGCSH